MSTDPSSSRRRARRQDRSEAPMRLPMKPSRRHCGGLRHADRAPVRPSVCYWHITVDRNIGALCSITTAALRVLGRTSAGDMNALLEGR